MIVRESVARIVVKLVKFTVYENSHRSPTFRVMVSFWKLKHIVLNFTTAESYQKSH